MSEPIEKVNHPKHYNSHPTGIEAIDIIEHFPSNISNTIKYAWRAGLKPGASKLEDLEKAAWYANRAVAMEKKFPSGDRAGNKETHYLDGVTDRISVVHRALSPIEMDNLSHREDIMDRMFSESRRTKKQKRRKREHP